MIAGTQAAAEYLSKGGSPLNDAVDTLGRSLRDLLRLIAGNPVESAVFFVVLAVVLFRITRPR